MSKEQNSWGKITKAPAPNATRLATDDAIQNRARLDAALLAAEFGTWLWDIKSDTVRGDRNLNAMFGLPPDAADGRPIGDYIATIHPDDRSRIAQAIEQTMATGARYEVQYRTIGGGRERWVCARGIVARDAQGVPIEFSGVLVDISRQKALDAEHQQLLARVEAQARIFDTALSAIADFAYIFDLQGRFRYANKALLDLWGLPLEQAIGKNFFDLQYPTPLATQLQNQIQQVIDTRTTELLPRLFDLFVQGERTLDRAQGGLGIGLAVVKRLVEMHAGSATSAGPGKGTTFEITLPRTPGVQTTQGKPELAQSQPRRILVVDDNADSAHSLSLLLSFEGHETQTAYTAADALQLIESFQPDVVLLDIGLPKMDGYEVARCVRKLTRGNSIRLIAVTGYGQPNDRARTRDAGFDAHLVKPIDLAALERALLERAPDV